MIRPNLHAYLLALTGLVPLPAAASSNAPGTPLWFCETLEQSQSTAHFAACKPNDWSKADGQSTIQATQALTQQCLDLIMAGEADKRLEKTQNTLDNLIGTSLQDPALEDLQIPLALPPETNAKANRG